MQGNFFEDQKQSFQLSSTLPDVTEHQEKKLNAEIRSYLEQPNPLQLRNLYLQQNQ